MKGAGLWIGRRTLLFSWCVLCLGALIRGQKAPAAAPSSYLLRLERLQNNSSACVLVQSDGQYHLELHLQEKTGFYEGNLSSNDLGDLIRILSADKLVHLKQDDIRSPFADDGWDELWVTIFRAGSERQKLTFPSPGFAFVGTVGPLMQWLDRMEKRKGRKRSEEAGRNNCAIPGEKEIRLTARPSGSVKNP